MIYYDTAMRCELSLMCRQCSLAEIPGRRPYTTPDFPSAKSRAPESSSSTLVGAVLWL